MSESRQEKLERIADVIGAQPTNVRRFDEMKVWGDPHGGCSPVALPNVAVVSTPRSIGAMIFDLEGNPIPEKPEHWSEP